MHNLVQQYSLDHLRWKYYREFGYDDALAETVRQQGGVLALVLYWRLFDTYSIERLLSEHRDCVFDFGAGAGTNESEKNMARVGAALAPYRDVILLLPSPDIEEPLRILKARGPAPPLTHGFDFNRHSWNAASMRASRSTPCTPRTNRRKRRGMR